MAYSDTTVIIPTLNEENNISELLEKLISFYKKINIIIADDGSKDKTQEIVRSYHRKNRNIILLNRSKENIHGLTASVIDAVKIVKTAYIIVMDGDMQHPPEKVKNIIEKLRQDNDVVIAVRKMVHFGSFFRSIMSKIAIILGQLRLLCQGILCQDIVSGFFGVRTKLFQNKVRKYESKFEKQGYKVLFDLLKLLPSKVKIGEVLYAFGERIDGKSKINKKHVLIYIRSLFK